LRHTYISNIMRSGASVKVCQELARHSDPKLTLGVYTHLQAHDKTAALDALRPMTPDRPERESVKATGTYNVRATHPVEPHEKRAAHAQRTGAPKGDSVRLHATSERKQAAARKHLQSLKKCVFSKGNKAPAPVAQLDRASVFGTEAKSAEPTESQELTETADGARSACAAPGSKNDLKTNIADGDLARVIGAWPHLPEPVRAGIAAMVKAARPTAGKRGD